MKALFIILTGLLVLVNAFFVIAEYAIVRSRRARLEALVDEGARGARLALRQIDDIGDYIAACQVGITMASIGIGALGEPAIAHLFEPLLGSPLGHTAAVAVSVVIAYLLITITQSIIGEIVPKLYTIQHAEGLARADRRADAVLPVAVPPVHLRAELGVEVDPAHARDRPGRRARGRHPGRAQAADRPVLHGRAARRRRGEHADRACFTCTSRRLAR